MYDMHKISRYNDGILNANDDIPVLNAGPVYKVIEKAIVQSYEDAFSYFVNSFSRSKRGSSGSVITVE